MFIFVEWVRAVCARLGGKKRLVCVRAVCARLGGKVVESTDVLADERKNN